MVASAVGDGKTYRTRPALRVALSLAAVVRTVSPQKTAVVFGEPEMEVVAVAMAAVLKVISGEGGGCSALRGPFLVLELGGATRSLLPLLTLLRVRELCRRHRDRGYDNGRVL